MKGQKMNRPKGTKDIYGDIQVLREYLEYVTKSIAEINNFKKIDTPIFEKKEVFTKSVGENSDIVLKEMYLFKDKKDREMALKPEGTAGIIRAIVENKLFSAQMPLKFYYNTSCFRYERPQKGRQRQFTQFGVEMFSEETPFADAEVILMAKQILDILKIKYKLCINSLGSKETREKYSLVLKKYFNMHKKQLTEDSVNRIETNPMRILDDKIDGKKDFVKNSPKISEFYDEGTKKYFSELTNFLDILNIEYEVNHALVRGLDYYSNICFEFISISNKAGSQDTLIGGGRYSDLVKQFGGPSLSGVGFGMGIERVINEINDEALIEQERKNPDIFVMNISKENTDSIAAIVYLLRKAGFITEWNINAVKLSKAFLKADKSKAKIKIIAGSKEIGNNTVTVKTKQKQEVIKIDKLINYLKGKI